MMQSRSAGLIPLKSVLQGKFVRRLLTRDEWELLGWILGHGSERARSYLQQLENLRAEQSCGCGCTSIKLFPHGSVVPTEAENERILCDLVGLTRGGDSIGLILFEDDGKLSELEIYPFEDFKTKDSNLNFPDIASLRGFEPGSPLPALN